jgi:DNA-3-methyladenine glycosylase
VDSGLTAPSSGSDPSAPRERLAGSTLAAARFLLGLLLVRDPDPGESGVTGISHERRIGRIVEVEAYLGTDDQASHARMGRTARNEPMFGDPGRAYVYLVYGMHHCLNVVTEAPGRPAAVLIRAVEPVEGSERMREARLANLATRGPTPEAMDRARARLALGPDTRLAAGPGLVGACFSVDRSHSGLDLCDPASPLRLELPAVLTEMEIEATPRVGVAYAGEPWASRPWRLLDAASPSLSGSEGRRSRATLGR